MKIFDTMTNYVINNFFVKKKEQTTVLTVRRREDIKKMRKQEKQKLCSDVNFILNSVERKELHKNYSKKNNVAILGYSPKKTAFIEKGFRRSCLKSCKLNLLCGNCKKYQEALSKVYGIEN